ncbi:hypothetical protein G9A89_002505 [Geosiphon pyriformis]|nr:hypothetical protein G9A89_002505 [Geosiphon pyriformis]
MGSSNIEELPSVLPIFAKAANGTQVELCRFDLFFRMSLAILQAGYVGTCKYHPSGCFQIDKERHILLTESMLKTWAILTATDKSINRDELPEFKELPEFWHENAVYIQHKNRK